MDIHSGMEGLLYPNSFNAEENEYNIIKNYS